MRYILLILTCTYLFANMTEKEQFEYFDKQDKKEFKLLKGKINKCIKDWNFSCADSKLKIIKRYVTSKKDVQTIRRLKNILLNEKSKKRAQEEAQRRANAYKSIKITDCQNRSGGTVMCTLYVNGNYDGNIFYKLKDTDKYNIFILGSKNAATNSGYYDIKLHSVWTTRCGDSVFGRSNRISVYDISTALNMFANCSINGRY